MYSNEQEVPECSQAFLNALKEHFDIRKLIYEKTASVDYLLGIQEVLDFIENNNESYH